MVHVQACMQTLSYGIIITPHYANHLRLVYFAFSLSVYCWLYKHIVTFTNNYIMNWFKCMNNWNGYFHCMAQTQQKHITKFNTWADLNKPPLLHGSNWLSHPKRIEILIFPNNIFSEATSSHDVFLVLYLYVRS